MTMVIQTEHIKDIEASFAFYKDAIVKLPQLAEICSKIDNISYTTEDIDNLISMPNVDINMTRRQKDNKFVSTKGTLQIVYKGCHQMLVLIEEVSSDA